MPAAPLRWSLGDRLCAAHFAVIMFGLVALVGPAHSAGAMLLAVGLVAVMCLAVHGALLIGNGAHIAVRGMIEEHALPCTVLPNVMLRFLRQSSLLAGAPPAAEASKFSMNHAGGADWSPHLLRFFRTCAVRQVH